MTVLLIRHAHAGERGSVTPDHVRELSPRGWNQARGLVDLLAPFEISHIASSPYIRCRQTVEPLAEARGRDIADDRRLAEGADARDVDALLDDVAPGTVLCSHGDTIPAILFALDRRGVDFEDELDWPKASTWVLEGSRGEFRTARFLDRPSG